MTGLTRWHNKRRRKVKICKKLVIPCAMTTTFSRTNPPMHSTFPAFPTSQRHSTKSSVRTQPRCSVFCRSKRANHPCSSTTNRPMNKVTNTKRWTSRSRSSLVLWLSLFPFRLRNPTDLICTVTSMNTILLTTLNKCICDTTSKRRSITSELRLRICRWPRPRKIQI